MSCITHYRQSEPRLGTNKTAYAVAFGSEVILLAELALPTYRVSTFDEVRNKRQHCLDLDLLEERRITTRLKAKIFKQKTKFANEKDLVSMPICIGDWVLRKIESTVRQIKENKLTPNWEGPYLIKEEVRPGTFQLIDQNGKTLPNPWYVNHLKKNYA